MIFVIYVIQLFVCVYTEPSEGVCDMTDNNTKEGNGYKWSRTDRKETEHMVPTDQSTIRLLGILLHYPSSNVLILHLFNVGCIFLLPRL